MNPHSVFRLQPIPAYVPVFIMLELHPETKKNR